MNPKISVLLSAYNAEKFIGPAIESVLQQTFTDFEFIITNDGSSDGTLKAIQSFEDPRIIVVDNKENLNCSRSGNHMLDIARGEYLAIMDADDICLPNRLEIQNEFLEKHSEIGIVGTSACHIDVDGNLLKPVRQNDRVEEVEFRSIFVFPFYNPSTMFRRSIVENNRVRIDESFGNNGQDYAFFNELKKYCRITNLPDILLKFRIHGTSICGSGLDKQIDGNIRVSQKGIDRYLSEEEKEPFDLPKILRSIQTSKVESGDEIEQTVSFLNLVMDGYCKSASLQPSPRLRAVIGRILFKIILKNKHLVSKKLILKAMFDRKYGFGPLLVSLPFLAGWGAYQRIRFK